MYIPKLKEAKTINVAIETVMPYIDWVFFFRAWGISGRFDGLKNFCNCESCRQDFLLKNRHLGAAKAKEALDLYANAISALELMQKKKLVSIKAKLMICKARSENEGITIASKGNRIYLPMLRQQHAGERCGCCVSMCDFVSPSEDYVGVFALSVKGADEMAEKFKKEGNYYDSILAKSLGDRLAEATSEWLHQKCRKEYWAYAPDEDYTPEELMRVPYQGIRPAIGYPSIPDLSLIFRVDQLIDLSSVGISATENGAMKPNASICGLYISHPKSFYFMVGKIGDDQLEDYAKRCGRTVEETRRWLHNQK